MCYTALDRLNPTGLALLRSHRLWAGTLAVASVAIWIWFFGAGNVGGVLRLVSFQLGSTFAALMVGPWMFDQARQEVSPFRLLVPPTGVWALWLVPLVEMIEAGAV